MEPQPGSPRTQKPVSELVQPELTRLPELHARRRFVRRILRAVIWLLLHLLARIEARGVENIPRVGPALAVSNHLGDADVLVGLACSPVEFEVVAKVELHEIPVLGRLLDAYGMIWIHRGQADRRAMRMILEGLADRRVIVIAPEGRESLTGALEEGTNGAAYLALKANIPILPIALTGTENKRIFAALKQFKRPRITFTAGPLYWLEPLPNRQQAVQAGTAQIMRSLAQMLPPEYRGVYQDVETKTDGS